MRRAFFLSFFLLLALVASASPRQRVNFDRNWLFTLGDDKAMATVGYDDRAWRRLNLPHDWAIEGDFSVTNPSGASGGALPGGIGWYRKHFTLTSALKGQAQDRVFVDFDGVYMNATVYINGHELGTRPYGYSSFRYDITPYVNRNGDNVVAVRVDNSDQPNSRWYSGCGIYRHVWLVSTASLHVDHWGLHVITEPKKANNSSFKTAMKAPAKTWSVTTSVTLKDEAQNGQHPMVRTVLVDGDGHTVAQAESGRPQLSMTVKSPHLWSPEDPYIYKVRAQVIVDGNVVDEVTTTTAFRDFCFDAKTGFWLNGKNTKLKGVCQHHDMGCLGAALNEDALHRQLTMLKDMGVNALRCSHNPPAPELLDMCDTMGLMVMDESFDMWHRRKSQNDYARFFDQWHVRDLTDLVVRDRNHPSIILWSIGNEVLEQWSSADADTLTLEQANLLLNARHDASQLASGKELSPNSILTQHLVDIVKDLDPTRPVTAGCNEPDPNNHLFRSGALDIIGFNYHHQWVKDVPRNFPGKPFIFTESESSLHTRGFYMMPSDSLYLAPKRWDIPYTDPSMKCSSYDNMCASWGSTHEQTWDVVKHNAFVGGQFIWTGWDYIGEPTPYGYPARSSYFGLIDLAGFKKDPYYMYQSEWSDKDVLHLFPHWNWLEGQTVDLWCYYNHADSVELFVNNVSKGVRRKADSHQYHVAWRVPFEKGAVCVVAYQKGKPVRVDAIRTAGTPSQIRLTPDRTVMAADGRALTFVTVEVTDKDGIVCPWAEDDLFFTVDGPATIAGVDNGCPYSTERFQANHRKAYFGKCLVVLRSGENAGTVTLKVQGYNLQPAQTQVSVK